MKYTHTLTLTMEDNNDLHETATQLARILSHSLTTLSTTYNSKQIVCSLLMMKDFSLSPLLIVSPTSSVKRLKLNLSPESKTGLKISKEISNLYVRRNSR